MPIRAAVILIFIAFGIVSYLLGSVSFAVIFTRAFAHTDVREHGSGNAGMTNVMRTAGLAPGVLTLLCDVLKAAVSVVLGKYLLTFLANLLLQRVYGQSMVIDSVYGAVLCGFCCVIGHIFPVFFRFRGGKGVLTSLGMVFVLEWRAALILLAVFGVTFALSRMVSLSSIMAAVSYPVSTWFLSGGGDAPGTFYPFGMSSQWFQTLAALLFALVVIFKHKDNIRRILQGQEKRFTIKK